MSANQAVVADSSDSFDVTAWQWLRRVLIAYRAPWRCGASCPDLAQRSLRVLRTLLHGLHRSRAGTGQLLTSMTEGFFGLNGIASYIAATSTGMFIGTFVFGIVSDRAGCRPVFTYSLLRYIRVFSDSG